VRGQCHHPTALYPGKDPVPILQEAGWAPGPVWTGAENLAPTGIRSPDRQSRRQSLYRLNYRAHTNVLYTQLNKQISKATKKFFLEMLTRLQLVTKFSTLCGNLRFITAFTTARAFSPYPETDYSNPHTIILFLSNVSFTLKHYPSVEA
jgi:hypothetical protein